jgi:hypothetical protein
MTDMSWRTKIVADKLHVRARGVTPLSTIDDIIFVVFEVRELYERKPSGDWLFISREDDGILRETADIEAADLLVSGTVKWDGCVDYNWNQEKGSLHICSGRAGARQLADMFNEIFDLAIEIMPRAAEYIND